MAAASAVAQFGVLGPLRRTCPSHPAQKYGNRCARLECAAFVRRIPNGFHKRPTLRANCVGAGQRRVLLAVASEAIPDDSVGSVAVEDTEKSAVAEGVADVDEKSLSPAAAEDAGENVVEDSVANVEEKTLSPAAAEDAGENVVEDSVADVEEKTLSPAAAEDAGENVVEDSVADVEEKTLSPAAAEDAGENVVEDSVADVEEQKLSASPEEEEDRQHIETILRVVELLRTKRDMTFNETRLTIVIEDPREVERRRILNIEDERGCSREELGDALVEVYEGRVPQDRLVLRELAKEMLNWPNLEEEFNLQNFSSLEASPYAKATDTGVDPRIAAERAKVDWDKASDMQPGQETKELSEVLPPAVGFSFLYLISALPVIIGITVIAILFFNSLQ